MGGGGRDRLAASPTVAGRWRVWPRPPQQSGSVRERLTSTELNAVWVIPFGDTCLLLTPENAPKSYEQCSRADGIAADLGREIVNLFVRWRLTDPNHADACIKAAQDLDPAITEMKKRCP